MVVVPTPTRPVGLRRRTYTYQVYGILFDSEMELPCPKGVETAPSLCRVHLVSGHAKRFAEARSGIVDRTSWFQSNPLTDGSIYLCWKNLFEFIVSSDGRTVECRKLKAASTETFSTYLLGQVLSFALLAVGIEPLHGTAAVIHGRAILLIGDCGFGKSTLGAALMARGYPVVTDDLAVFRLSGGQYWIQSGMPRLKLFPDSIVSTLSGRRGVEMVHGVGKRLIPLRGMEIRPTEAPLGAIYVLEDPDLSKARKNIVIQPLQARDAFLSLVRNTFNAMVTTKERVEKQFNFCEGLTRAVPIRTLCYPRSLKALGPLCERLVKDSRESTLCLR